MKAKHYRSFLSALIVLIMFTGMPFELSAQKKYKTMGKKCKSVYITDPGELYSSYEFTKDDLKILTDEGFSETRVSEIQTYGNESAWPQGMANLSSRRANADKIKEYKAYLLIKLKGKCIVVIPAKHNSSRPEGWIPEEDIYLVIGEGGLKW